MDQNDELIRIVNDNHMRARLRSLEQERREREDYYQERRNLYKVQKAKKRKEIRNNAILAICASAVIVASLHGISSELDKSRAKQDFVASLSDGVIENTVYTNTLNSDGNGYTWYYDDINDIANRTVNDHKDIDIDTRIYSTYSSLKEYKKEDYMNEIMQRMQEIVTENPDAYTEEEIRACNNTTFADYLMGLGLDKEEYMNLMQDITLAYSINDQEKVSQLLNKLTEGLNGGGR